MRWRLEVEMKSFLKSWGSVR